MSKYNKYLDLEYCVGYVFGNFIDSSNPKKKIWVSYDPVTKTFWLRKFRGINKSMGNKIALFDDEFFAMRSYESSLVLDEQTPNVPYEPLSWSNCVFFRASIKYDDVTGGQEYEIFFVVREGYKSALVKLFDSVVAE